jgi:folate-binding protein YgfZ
MSGVPADGDALGGARALAEGRAYADLSGRRVIAVEGDEALTWLNDLLSADLAGMEPGRARRSLLLTPTGRVRADLTVVRATEGFLLIQDALQPSVGESLRPYVLSAQVSMEDRGGSVTLLAFPGGAPSAAAGMRSDPSVLGVGQDLLGTAEQGETLREAARAAGLVPATGEATEAWRIERGAARLEIDLRTDSLPQEAGLDHAIGWHKGCYLGQEAVARVSNLGHPPWVVLHGRAEGPLAAGEAVRAGEEEVGTVTSAAPAPGGGTAAIARVRWAAREGPLTAGEGIPLEVRGPASA